MEYADSITLTSDYFLQRLQGIQYKALKIIFKKKQDAPVKRYIIKQIFQQ